MGWICLYLTHGIGGTVEDPLNRKFINNIFKKLITIESCEFVVLFVINVFIICDWISQMGLYPSRKPSDERHGSDESFWDSTYNMGCMGRRKCWPCKSKGLLSRDFAISLQVSSNKLIYFRKMIITRYLFIILLTSSSLINKKKKGRKKM